MEQGVYNAFPAIPAEQLAIEIVEKGDDDGRRLQSFMANVAEGFTGNWTGERMEDLLDEHFFTETRRDCERYTHRPSSCAGVVPSTMYRPRRLL